MPQAAGSNAFLAVALVAGIPFIRSSSTVPRGESEGTAAVAAAPSSLSSPSHIVLLRVDSADYRALAIPKSYKSEPDALLHLLVFRDGLCVRDRGLMQIHDTTDAGKPGMIMMQETGVTERAAVAPDAREAIVASTRYVSRVDVTPGHTSTKDDTVTGATTLTLVEPAHPDGRWTLTLEHGRWVKDLIVLAHGKGVALTSFVPRNGPTDVRILGPDGREAFRVPETSGETLRVDASPDGGFVAAEMSFAEGASPFERGVTVFDLAHGTQWTYGWRYGGDEEPSSWTLQDQGVFAIVLPGGKRRFDPAGHRL